MRITGETGLASETGYGPRRAETGIADRGQKPPKRPNTRMRGSHRAGNALSYRGFAERSAEQENQLRTVAVKHDEVVACSMHFAEGERLHHGTVLAI